MLAATLMFHFERAATWVRRKFICRHVWTFAERQPELLGLAAIRAKCAKCERESLVQHTRIIG
jgi:hypothetical protein